MQKLQTATKTNWQAVFFASLVWWAIPIVVLNQPQNDEPSAIFAFACLLGIMVALCLCANLRDLGWIVLVWVPVLIWTSLGTLITLRSLAAESGGGPNYAPLAGVAMAIGMVVALILVAAAILCLVWRPRVYSVPLIILAIANTVAVSFATQQSNLHATRQEITLHVLDSGGKPLPGASVRFTRYGYGPQGTHVYDGRGGPIVSGDDGIVKIPSRRMRYETKGTITKTGFRDVLFDIDMQFSKWDQNRTVRISTPETQNIAWADIPTTEPVTLSIYLPQQIDAPDRLHPIKPVDVSANIGQGQKAAHILNLETGKFGEGPEGDIRFDLFFEIENGQHERPRLRITGVNGAKVLQVPPHVSLSGSLSPFEHVFRIASQTGYQEDTVIARPGDSPGPMIYVSARNGHLFARFTVDAWGRSKEAKAPCRVKLFVNSTGGRLLE